MWAKGGEGRGLPKAGQEMSGSRALAAPTGKETRQSSGAVWGMEKSQGVSCQGHTVPCSHSRTACAPQASLSSPACAKGSCQPIALQNMGSMWFLGNHKEHPAWAVPGTRRGRCPLSPPVPNRNLRTSAQAWDPPRMLWRKKPHSWDRDWWVWKFPPAGGEKPSSG